MKKRPWGLIVLLALLLSGCAIMPIEAGYGDRIKVLILKGAGELKIKGSGQELYIKAAGKTALVNGEEAGLPIKFRADEDGLIYLNNRPYRGSLEVFNDGRGLSVVDELLLEEYLVGIINNEISSKWHTEAIKAQAVIARTYALWQRNKRLNEPWHIEGSVMGQVYTGIAAEDAASMKAVRETSGEVLTFAGEPALTVYHSNAGGMTESSKEVWSKYYPYLNPVKSGYDSVAPKYLWDYSVDAGALKTALEAAGYKTGEPRSIEVNSTSQSGRVRSVMITDIEGRRFRISGEDLRKALGYNNIKSTLFEVGASGKAFVFKGRGAGHGVGLSQWGAKGMAENGYGYRQILGHYYPGTTIMKVY